MGELSFRHTPFAQTDNLQIANETPSAITNYCYPTVLCVDDSKYYIEVLSGTRNYIDYAAVELDKKALLQMMFSFRQTSILIFTLHLLSLRKKLEIY